MPYMLIETWVWTQGARSLIGRDILMDESGIEPIKKN